MESDKRIETLEDEFKLIKGEVKQTLASVRDYLLSSDLPASEYATIIAALGGGGGDQKIEMKGEFSLPKKAKEPPKAEEETDEELAEEEPGEGSPREELLGEELPEAELLGEELPESGLPGKELPEAGLPGEELPEAELPGEGTKPGKTSERASQSTPPVNLMANLIRWVSNAKQEIGSEQLPLFLEVYGISGHLSPEMKEVILHLADIASESSADANPAGIWSRLISELHGILTGGDAPLHPVTPFWGDGGSEAQLGETGIEREEDKSDDEPMELKVEEDSPKDKSLKLKLVFPSGNGKEKEFCINLDPDVEGDEPSGRSMTTKKTKQGREVI